MAVINFKVLPAASAAASAAAAAANSIYNCHMMAMATARGLLYLDLDDNWIFNLQQELARLNQDILGSKRE